MKNPLIHLRFKQTCMSLDWGWKSEHPQKHHPDHRVNIESGSQTAGKAPTGRTQRYSRGPQKIRQQNSEVKLNEMIFFFMKNEPKQFANAIVMMFHFFLKSLVVIFFILPNVSRARPCTLVQHANFFFSKVMLS